MMDISKAAKFQNLEILSRIKQRQIHCPIINQRAIASPLLTIEDLALKTTLASIDIYDEQLTRILYEHTSFVDLSEPMPIESFIHNVSLLDRRVITWGVFASSFNTLGKVQVSCPHCNETFEDEIFADQLIQEDSFVLWDKPQPFNEYVHILQIIPNQPGLYKLELNTGLPSIAQYIETIRQIPPEKIRENFRNTGTIMSKVEELTSVTKSIKMWESEDSTTPTEWTTREEIHFVIGKYFPIDLSKSMLNQYDEHFGKYAPVFKKKYTCPSISCKQDFFFVADPEVSLFRQFLE